MCVENQLQSQIKIWLSSYTGPENEFHVAVLRPEPMLTHKHTTVQQHRDSTGSCNMRRQQVQTELRNKHHSTLDKLFTSTLSFYIQVLMDPTTTSECSWVQIQPPVFKSSQDQYKSDVNAHRTAQEVRPSWHLYNLLVYLKTWCETWLKLVPRVSYKQSLLFKWTIDHIIRLYLV